MCGGGGGKSEAWGRVVENVKLNWDTSSVHREALDDDDVVFSMVRAERMAVEVYHRISRRGLKTRKDFQRFSVPMRIEKLLKTAAKIHQEENSSHH